MSTKFLMAFTGCLAIIELASAQTAGLFDVDDRPALASKYESLTVPERQFVDRVMWFEMSKGRVSTFEGFKGMLDIARLRHSNPEAYARQVRQQHLIETFPYYREKPSLPPFPGDPLSLPAANPWSYAGRLRNEFNRAVAEEPVTQLLTSGAALIPTTRVWGTIASTGANVLLPWLDSPSPVGGAVVSRDTLFGYLDSTVSLVLAARNDSSIALELSGTVGNYVLVDPANPTATMVGLEIAEKDKEHLRKLESKFNTVAELKQQSETAESPQARAAANDELTAIATEDARLSEDIGNAFGADADSAIEDLLSMSDEDFYYAQREVRGAAAIYTLLFGAEHQTSARRVTALADWAVGVTALARGYHAGRVGKLATASEWFGLCLTLVNSFSDTPTFEEQSLTILNDIQRQLEDLKALVVDGFVHLDGRLEEVLVTLRDENALLRQRIDRAQQLLHNALADINRVNASVNLLQRVTNETHRSQMDALLRAVGTAHCPLIGALNRHTTPAMLEAEFRQCLRDYIVDALVDAKRRDLCVPATSLVRLDTTLWEQQLAETLNEVDASFASALIVEYLGKFDSSFAAPPARVIRSHDVREEVPSGYVCPHYWVETVDSLLALVNRWPQFKLGVDTELLTEVARDGEVLLDRFYLNEQRANALQKSFRHYEESIRHAQATFRDAMVKYDRYGTAADGTPHFNSADRLLSRQWLMGQMRVLHTEDIRSRQSDLQLSFWYTFREQFVGQLGDENFYKWGNGSNEPLVVNSLVPSALPEQEESRKRAIGEFAQLYSVTSLPKNVLSAFKPETLLMLDQGRVYVMVSNQAHRETVPWGDVRHTGCKGLLHRVDEARDGCQAVRYSGVVRVILAPTPLVDPRIDFKDQVFFTWITRRGEGAIYSEQRWAEHHGEPSPFSEAGLRALWEEAFGPPVGFSIKVLAESSFDIEEPVPFRLVSRRKGLYRFFYPEKKDDVAYLRTALERGTVALVPNATHQELTSYAEVQAERQRKFERDLRRAIKNGLGSAVAREAYEILLPEDATLLENSTVAAVNRFRLLALSMEAVCPGRAPECENMETEISKLAPDQLQVINLFELEVPDGVVTGPTWEDYSNGGPLFVKEEAFRDAESSISSLLPPTLDQAGQTARLLNSRVVMLKGLAAQLATDSTSRADMHIH